MSEANHISPEESSSRRVTRSRVKAENSETDTSPSASQSADSVPLKTRKGRASVDREMQAKITDTPNKSSPTGRRKTRRMSQDQQLDEQPLRDDTPLFGRSVRALRSSVDRESATGTPKLVEDSSENESRPAGLLRRSRRLSTERDTQTSTPKRMAPVLEAVAEHAEVEKSPTVSNAEPQISPIKEDLASKSPLPIKKRIEQRLRRFMDKIPMGRHSFSMNSEDNDSDASPKPEKSKTLNKTMDKDFKSIEKLPTGSPVIREVSIPLAKIDRSLLSSEVDVEGETESVSNASSKSLNSSQKKGRASMGPVSDEGEQDKSQKVSVPSDSDSLSLENCSEESTTGTPMKNRSLSGSQLNTSLKRRSLASFRESKLIDDTAANTSQKSPKHLSVHEQNDVEDEEQEKSPKKMNKSQSSNASASPKVTGKSPKQQAVKESIDVDVGSKNSSYESAHNDDGDALESDESDSGDEVETEAPNKSIKMNASLNKSAQRQILEETIKSQIEKEIADEGIEDSDDDNELKIGTIRSKVMDKDEEVDSEQSGNEDGQDSGDEANGVVDKKTSGKNKIVDSDVDDDDDDDDDDEKEVEEEDTEESIGQPINKASPGKRMVFDSGEDGDDDDVNGEEVSEESKEQTVDKNASPNKKLLVDSEDEDDEDEKDSDELKDLSVDKKASPAKQEVNGGNDEDDSSEDEDGDGQEDDNDDDSDGSDGPFLKCEDMEDVEEDEENAATGKDNDSDEDDAPEEQPISKTTKKQSGVVPSAKITQILNTCSSFLTTKTEEKKSLRVDDEERREKRKAQKALKRKRREEELQRKAEALAREEAKKELQQIRNQEAAMKRAKSDKKEAKSAGKALGEGGKKAQEESIQKDKKVKKNPELLSQKHSLKKLDNIFASNIESKKDLKRQKKNQENAPPSKKLKVLEKLNTINEKPQSRDKKQNDYVARKKPELIPDKSYHRLAKESKEEQKMLKKSLKHKLSKASQKEPLRVLPKPVWTASGAFEVEYEERAISRAQTTKATDFVVQVLDRSLGSSSSSSASAPNFKEEFQNRKGIRREDSHNLLKRRKLY